MTEQLICISCKRNVTNETGVSKFLCPKCGKSLIIRCRHCREIAAKYECPNCHFTGPN